MWTSDKSDLSSKNRNCEKRLNWELRKISQLSNQGYFWKITINYEQGQQPLLTDEFYCRKPRDALWIDEKALSSYWKQSFTSSTTIIIRMDDLQHGILEFQLNSIYNLWNQNQIKIIFILIFFKRYSGWRQKQWSWGPVLSFCFGISKCEFLTKNFGVLVI